MSGRFLPDRNLPISKAIYNQSMKTIHTNSFGRWPVIVRLAFAVATAGLPIVSRAAETPTASKPTIVLVHGAFADSSGWNAVMNRLLAQGYPVVAVANPLRGLRSDSNYLASAFRNIEGPIVAVGHSYAGSVVTNAAAGNPNVKALVYVAGFAPEAGESALGLSGLFPGSTLGAALAPPVILPSGDKDLYILQDRFPEQFAADVPLREAKLMAAAQRPVTESALQEPAEFTAWKTVPSWFIFGSLDKNIPEATLSFMARRAKAKEVVDIPGASHVIMISHPDAVADVIEKAAVFVGTKQVSLHSANR